MFSFILSPFLPPKLLIKLDSSVWTYFFTCFPLFVKPTSTHILSRGAGHSFLLVIETGLHVLLNSVTFLHFRRHLPSSFLTHLSFLLSYRCRDIPPSSLSLVVTMRRVSFPTTFFLYSSFAGMLFSFSGNASSSEGLTSLIYLSSVFFSLLKVSHTKVAMKTSEVQSELL